METVVASVPLVVKHRELLTTNVWNDEKAENLSRFAFSTFSASRENRMHMAYAYMQGIHIMNRAEQQPPFKTKSWARSHVKFSILRLGDILSQGYDGNLETLSAAIHNDAAISHISLVALEKVT